MSLDDLQAQLRGALDQQFAALKHQYELSIEEARRDAVAEAEREFAAKLDLARAEYHQARTEWESQLQELVIAARADAEQCAAQAAAVERQEYQQHLQVQLEQRVEQAAAAAQRSAALEQEAERRRAQSEIEAAREQAKAEVDAERQRLQQEVEAERQRAQQERDVERQRLQQEVAAARQRLQQERESERAQAEQIAQQEREAVRQQMQQAAQQEREAERQQIQQEREAERQQVQQERDAERQQVHQERDAERQQLKQLLMAERQKMQQQLAAEGERARQEVEALTARHQAELAAAKQAAAAAATAAAAAAATAATATAAATAAAAKAAIPAPAGAPATGLSPAAFDRVLAAISDLDGTHTLASALDLLLAHSGAVAGRAALFLIDGDRLKAWKSSGIPDADARAVSSPIAGADLLARAIQTGRATPSSSEVPAPPFAKLPADRVGLAVPVMIGGRAVAVLYADSGAKPSPPGSDATIELLARHTSTVVALRTAMRTLDVLRGVPADTPNGHADEQSARRFAKLLISEIKLYNEPAVRAGRQQRDLRQRLRSEIDRAQRLYEERVPPGVSARSAYFQQELVQTLADGDAALLGSG
jgi:hypothetical protein